MGISIAFVTSIIDASVFLPKMKGHCTETTRRHICTGVWCGHSWALSFQCRRYWDRCTFQDGMVSGASTAGWKRQEVRFVWSQNNKNNHSSTTSHELFKTAKIWLLMPDIGFSVKNLWLDLRCLTQVLPSMAGKAAHGDKQHGLEMED